MDSDFELWKLLDHARFMIGRLREMELAAFGLTPEQSHVLDILANSGGVTTINEIVRITQRQHHSISTLINRMSRQGLVSKKKDPSDQRKYSVLITARGRSLTGQISRRSILDSFSALSPQDKEVLDGYLRALLQQAYQLHGKGNQALFKQQ